MSALTIEVKEGKVSVSYEAKTASNIALRLKQLQKAFQIDEKGVLVMLDLKPTNQNVRLLKRWQMDTDTPSYQEMPEHKWKLLLILVLGQESNI
ncbi:hypothetical protein [Vibrio coralliilyticus]|uniref:hypothetical protein n=1 Tax=Vibrio coralliilyticus TaxID=190893 RepID=UPI000C169E49|nr:hypothetical protein [Vibrio coralliilyticus]